MDGQTRREEILKILRGSENPVPGTELARQLNVSRQIIVQDMALLRTGGADIISEAIVNAGVPAIFVPIILSAIIHVVTGSSTLACSTTAALVVPMLGTLGISGTAAFLGTCSAAMMFKHGNSSAFWMGVSLSGMSFPQGLKGIGIGCTIGSIFACIATVVMYYMGVC